MNSICHRPCCGVKVQTYPFVHWLVECFPMTKSHNILGDSKDKTEDTTLDAKDLLDFGNEIQS